MHRFHLILLALLCVSLKSGALEFRTLGLGVELETTLYYSVGAREEALQVPYNHVSGVYRFPSGRSQLELYRKVAGEEGEQMVPVVQIAVPQGLQSGILVFLPPAQGQRGLRTTWIDDSAWKAERNTVSFLNFSSQPVGVRLREQQWMLEPGQTQQSQFVASARSLPVQIAARGTAGWELVHTNRMPVRDGFNLFVFIKDGETDELGVTAMVDVVRFYETLPREPVGEAVAVGR